MYFWQKFLEKKILFLHSKGDQVARNLNTRAYKIIKMKKEQNARIGHENMICHNLNTLHTLFFIESVDVFLAV